MAAVPLSISPRVCHENRVSVVNSQLLLLQATEVVVNPRPLVLVI